MLGLIVIILASWLLLRFGSGEDLGVLGLTPTPSRLLQFGAGFVFVVCLALLQVAAESLFQSVEWTMVDVVDPSMIGASLWYHFKSALTEDLIFRGAILWLLIRWIGPRRALLLTALAFGVYHWFSYGMFGAIVPMIYVLIITGAAGYVWGYTFWKTGSVLMSLGFHLAWNFTMSLFYPHQPYGQLLFEETGRVELSGWGGLLFSIARGLIPPVLTYLFVRFGVERFMTDGDHVDLQTQSSDLQPSAN